MTEFKGPWEYRVSPIRAEWLTGVQARAAIDAWMNRTDETGAPAFTMTRRPRSREEEAVVGCKRCGCSPRCCACDAFVPED